MWFVGNTETGFVVKSPRGLTIEGIQYPRNIFTLWSKAELSAIGIKPYREVAIDTRYYNAGAMVRVDSGTEVVGTPMSTDKDVAALKKEMLASVRTQVASKQGAIDWYWSRASKGGKAVPTAVQTYASSVYTVMDTKESAIAALTTLADIKLYQNTPMTETRYIKHTSDEGVETYGPETETHDREVNSVMFGWGNSPADEVDLSFVSIVAV
tara:strand:- start:49 stop:681 length:633 start_codon:yes stop_codon:yes gene_type:complete